METKKLRNNLKVNRVSKDSKLFKIFTKKIELTLEIDILKFRVNFSVDNYYESQFISKLIYMHREQQMYSKSIRPKTFYNTQARTLPFKAIY